MHHGLSKLSQIKELLNKEVLLNKTDSFLINSFSQVQTYPLKLIRQPTQKQGNKDHRQVNKSNPNKQPQSIKNFTTTSHLNFQLNNTLLRESQPQFSKSKSKGKNKENKPRNCNTKSSLSKIQTEVILNNFKSNQNISKTSKHNNTQFAQPFANLPPASDTFSPKRSVVIMKNSYLNRHQSSNQFMYGKKSLNNGSDSRPLSPQSNNLSINQNILFADKSQAVLDSHRHLPLSPGNNINSIKKQAKNYVKLENQKSFQQIMNQGGVNHHQSEIIHKNQNNTIDKSKKPQFNNYTGGYVTSAQTSIIANSDQPISSCKRCETIDNKIVRIAVQLENINLSSNYDTLDLLEAISNSIIDFKLQRHQLDNDKLKLQQDVEKLVRNQESIEAKVKEIDELCALLVKEKESLRQQKTEFENLIKSKSETLNSYYKEVKSIKDVISEYKLEVRRVCEKEVKDIVYRKMRDKDYVYDYPCQVMPKKASQNQAQDQISITELKKREAELDKKESQLYEWEASLYEKKLKIDNQGEQLKGKLERMTAQKQEIGQNLKKLQILTQDYETILQKEYQISKISEDIKNAQKDMEKQKQDLEEAKQSLIGQKQEVIQQRDYLQKEKIDADKIDQRIQKIQERAQIQIEDNLSYLVREKEKCQQRMLQAQDLKNILQTEKDRWSKGVSDQQKKLQQLVDEKQEQVQVMEVSMRQQIKEIRERQVILEQKEKECDERYKLMMEEVELERRVLEKEKEDMKCLILEFEEKQGGRSANKNKKKYKKTNMPRQMPLKQSQQEQDTQLQFQQFEPQVHLQKQQQNLMQEFEFEEDDNLMVPQYAHQILNKTPQSNRKKGMPPKPPVLSQSTNKAFRKDNSLNKSQNIQNLNNIEKQQKLSNDLSLDQDQQLEQLLLMSSQDFLKTDNDFFKAKQGWGGQGQLDQYLASSQNDISLLNDDDDEINFN